MSGRPEPLDLVGWSAALLAKLGAPTSGNNLTSVTAWALAEGGHLVNQAAWNPLNTTRAWPGATVINSHGVKAYRTLGDGLAATVATVRLDHYARIRQALGSSAEPATVAALVDASPWGTDGGLMRQVVSRARAMVAARAPLATTYTGTTARPTAATISPDRVTRIFPVVDAGPALAAVTVNGAGLTANLLDAVTTARLEFATTEVTQLTITAEDPDLRIYKAGLFRARSLVRYGPLALEVSAVEVNGGSSGRGGFTMTARSRGAGFLRRTYSLATTNASPTEFAELAARKAGLLFVGEGSARRPSITLAAEPGQPREDAWAGLARLAQELGFVCFEAAGVLYFGRPTWLLGVLPPHTVRWRYGDTDPRIVGHPACRRTLDDPDAAVTVDVDLAPELGERFLVGSALHLEGVATFVARYMVTRASIDLGNPAAVVTVNAETPVDPEPQPPEPAGDGDDGAASYTAGTGGGGADGWVHPLAGQGRRSNNFGQDRGTHRHAGEDLGAPSGTPIYAARAGTVTHAGPAGSYGNLVKIAHAGGFETRYAHMVRQPSVRSGQPVQRGQLIGNVGSTGRSTGPHLHYEVRLNGVPQNPARYL